MGYLLLEGGAEFGGRMAEPDLRALQLAGGARAPMVILPTAAAPDNNHERAGRHGLRWFQSLGAGRVQLVPVIDRQTANDAGLAARVRAARLIYLLGGFPRYLAETLRGSRVWRAALEVYQDGGVIAGSSAGAMVLCEQYYDPQADQVLSGLDLLAQVCVLPHHQSAGAGWVSRLAARLPHATLLGIDEQTGVINEGAAARWTVYGAGKATLYRHGQIEAIGRAETFELETASPPGAGG